MKIVTKKTNDIKNVPFSIRFPPFEVCSECGRDNRKEQSMLEMCEHWHEEQLRLLYECAKEQGWD